MGQLFTCNSEKTLKNFQAHVEELWEKNKYVTFEWRIGPDRSMNQNALFHLWAREYAASLLGAGQKDVSEEILEGMKRTLKRECYRDTAWPFLTIKLRNLFSGEEKTDFRSSSNFKRGEMFQFMEWIQGYAAQHHNLILEAKGEFAKLKREQNA